MLAKPSLLGGLKVDAGGATYCWWCIHYWHLDVATVMRPGTGKF
jgi:hypothetical protein